MRRRALPKALWKPQLLMGCEKIPWIIAALCSGLIVMAAGTLVIRICGLIFGIALIIVIRLINRNEPWAFQIGSRYGLLQKFYLNVAKYPSAPYRPNNIDR
ncbi:MAG: hypothetical protein K0R94_1524 [Burkholderiales bacterium]|jgi:hypothetical protein|nr:hypothetical protein [Burkholderiales bacterium]